MCLVVLVVLALQALAQEQELAQEQLTEQELEVLPVPPQANHLANMIGHCHWSHNLGLA